MKRILLHALVASVALTSSAAFSAGAADVARVAFATDTVPVAVLPTDTAHEHLLLPPKRLAINDFFHHSLCRSFKPCSMITDAPRWLAGLAVRGDLPALSQKCLKWRDSQAV